MLASQRMLGAIFTPLVSILKEDEDQDLEFMWTVHELSTACAKLSIVKYRNFKETYDGMIGSFLVMFRKNQITDEGHIGSISPELAENIARIYAKDLYSSMMDKNHNPKSGPFHYWRDTDSNWHVSLSILP